MAEQSRTLQGRRSFIVLAAMAGLSLALASCAGGPRPPRQPPRAQPVQPEPVTNLPPDETRNRVAVLVPMTGPNAGVGQSIANAANMALLDTGGQRIRITIYDTARAGALAAANEALADGSGLFLGPLLADDAKAIAPVARRARVPVIAFSNDSSVAGNGVYLMGFTPEQSINRVVDYARSRGATRFGALVPQGVYGQRASAAVLSAVERSGGRMIGMQEYDRTPAGLKSAAGRLQAQGEYDAILIPDAGRNAASAAVLVKGGSSRTVRVLGTELWATEPGLAQLPGLRGAWFASAPETMFGQLRTRYRSRFGRIPYRLASLGYDAVLLAVRIAADWPVGRAFPQRALVDPGGFSGIDGAFRFDRDGIAERALQVQQVDAAGLSIVSPAPKGF